MVLVFLLLPKRRMFTKLLSVSLIIFSRGFLFAKKNDGSVEKRERYSEHLKLHEQSGLIESLKL